MTAGRDAHPLSVSFTKREREKVNAVAVSMGLTPASLVRGLAIGAITLGGSTLDRVLAVGSENTPMRGYGIDWPKFFPAKGKDPLGFPLREFVDDPTWFIVKQARAGSSRGADDPAKWWHLRRKFTNLNAPLAWGLKEACQLAHEQIQKVSRDAS